jgi:hypothetical protein
VTAVLEVILLNRLRREMKKITGRGR